MGLGRLYLQEGVALCRFPISYSYKESKMELFYTLQDKAMGMMPVDYLELMDGHMLALGAGVMYILALLYLVYATMVTARILCNSRLWMVKGHAFEHIAILGSILLVNATLILAIYRAPDPLYYILDMWVTNLLFVPCGLAAFAYISTARHLVRELNDEDCLVTAGVQLSEDNSALCTTVEKLNEENAVLRNKINSFIVEASDKEGARKS